MAKAPLLFAVALVLLVTLATSLEFAPSSPHFPFTLGGVSPFAARVASSSSALTCSTLECDRQVTEPCNTNCNQGSDCHFCDISNAYCTSQGTCANKKKIGEVCSSSSECPSGALSVIFGGENCVYNLTEGLSRCGNGKSSGAANDGCTDNSDCLSSLNCSNSVCVGKPEGADCSSSAECAFGLSCSNSKCTAQIPEGNSCAGQSDVCEDGASCIGGVCIMQFSKKEGDPCQRTEVCDAGLFCNSTTSKCQTSSPVKNCNGTGQCESGQTCACLGYNGDPFCYGSQSIYTKEMITAAKNLLACSKANQCRNSISDNNSESCLMKHCKNEFNCYAVQIMNIFGIPSSCHSGVTCKPNPGSQSSTNDASPSFTLASTAFQVLVIVAYFLLN